MTDDLHQLAYAAQVPPARPVRRATPPAYRLLDFGSQFILLIAGLVLIFGLTSIVVVVLQVWKAPVFVSEIPFAGVVVLVLACFTVSAMLGILGGIGVAVRDIARNSYRW